MTTLGPEGVRFTESNSFPMDDTLHSDIHGYSWPFYKLLAVCLTEMFVMVGSVILRLHCTYLWGEGGGGKLGEVYTCLFC